MTSWMSESADKRERASDQSLAGCPSRALKDAERTLASVMWLPGRGDLWRGQVWGGVKHIQLGHNIQEKGKSPHAFSPTHAHTYIYTPTPTHTVHTAHSAHICLYRQFDGDDDGDDAGRTLAAFRWLMSSVSFSAVFHPPLESIWCTSPTYINVMYQTVRARENRAAATILPFFAEFYYLCLSHLQALVHKCSCVLSIRFYQLCEVDCTRRSLKVTVPCEQQLFKMIYWYILHAHFIGITLVLVTVFYAWIDLMVS